MNHLPDKQNMRRPAPNRNVNMRKPVRQQARSTPPARRSSDLMIQRQQLGRKAKPPTRRPNPNASRNERAQRIARSAHNTLHPRGGSAHARSKQPLSRNFILAALFAALILITVIISTVQSCVSNKSTDGAVTTAPPKEINRAENFDGTADQADAFPAFASYTEETEDLVIDSEYGILIDLESNMVVASKNGDSKIYPASMTKIMTLVVAYEHLDDLDATYTFPAEIFDPLYQAGASVAGFKPGETVPYRDLLYGTILPSGADATVGLALAIAGSETGFAAMMNETAQRLGLENTHFVTVSGLHDDNHYSTCHEMALILEYAISIPELRQILSTYKYTTTATAEHPEGIELRSTMYSRMEGTEAEGMYVQGGKTGYTQEARHCLATFAAPCTEENAPYTRPRFILVTAFGWSEYKPVFDAINTYTKYKP